MTPGQATVAAIGKGTTIGFNTNLSGGTYTPVAEILDIKMPTHEAGTLEVERYDSPSLFPELIPGWNKGGNVEFKVTYAAAQAAALWALFGLLVSYQITKPDGKTWTYQAILNKFGDEVPLKDKITNTIGFAISGPPVPASASA